MAQKMKMQTRGRRQGLCEVFIKHLKTRAKRNTIENDLNVIRKIMTFQFPRKITSLFQQTNNCIARTPGTPP